VGGIIAGYMISAAQQNGQLQEHRKRLEQALSHFRKVLKESGNRLSGANNRLKKEFLQPIPDLYRATESLSLDEDELIYD